MSVHHICDTLSVDQAVLEHVVMQMMTTSVKDFASMDASVLEELFSTELVTNVSSSQNVLVSTKRPTTHLELLSRRNAIIGIWT